MLLYFTTHTFSSRYPRLLICTYLYASRLLPFRIIHPFYLPLLFESLSYSTSYTFEIVSTITLRVPFVSSILYLCDYILHPFASLFSIAHLAELPLVRVVPSVFGPIASRLHVSTNRIMFSCFNQ